MQNSLLERPLSYICLTNINLKPSDNHYLLCAALVFLAVLPKLLPT
ncbi:hypothetical protein LV84_02542 [Algoriphagus ratkowskyi]|uniref:Uncharacterized protein n=1 Tax=Algoriphagus ratkowskyi TaxID=57028 RepID=A0A2W7R4I7_9BACT|nr:hypothetical protein LV84_02542 [Algoriphagus ratkowskyi]